MATPKPLLEIACFDAESALLAASAGADRIELCIDYAAGGLTPATETLSFLRPQISIPIYVMIRPHAHSFVYSDEEYGAMLESIDALAAHGADGFVFGILHPDSLSIDVQRNKALVARANGKPCTFHRAFDLIPQESWDAALDDLVACGFASVLTSGGAGRAVDFVVQLGDLVRRARGRVEVVVGGGVRAVNLGALVGGTRARWFHSAALGEGEVSALRGVIDGGCFV